MIPKENSNKRRKMTYEDRWMAIGFLFANLNYAKCAEKLGFSPDKIEKLYHKYLKQRNVNSLPRVGLKMIQEIEDPYASTRPVSIAEDLSHSTIESYIHEAGLKFKHFIEKPKLTETHKLLRKNFYDANKSDSLGFLI